MYTSHLYGYNAGHGADEQLVLTSHQVLLVCGDRGEVGDEAGGGKEAHLEEEEKSR